MIKFGCSSSSRARVQTRAVLFEDLRLLSRPWDWFLRGRRPQGLGSVSMVGHGIRRLARCCSVSSLCTVNIHGGEESSGCGSFTTWRPMFHVSLLFGGYVDTPGGIDESVTPDLGFLRAVSSFSSLNTAAPMPGCLSQACLKVRNHCRVNGVPRC